MNRRNLFRFAGFAAVAAVVSRPAFFTDQQRMPRYLVMTRSHVSRDRAFRYFHSRETAFKYAEQTDRPKDTLRTVWGNLEEGRVLLMKSYGT